MVVSAPSGHTDYTFHVCWMPGWGCLMHIEATLLEVFG
jgi:hypothetical protein